MISLQSDRLYETKQIHDVCGDTVRPGGLTLSERALAYCKFSPQAKLMDVGCGYGATVEYLLARGYVNSRGIDPSPVMLKNALERNPCLPLLQSTAENLPCRDGELDGIFCECVLTLAADAGKVLKEFHRALGKGGLLVLSDMYDRSGGGSSRQGLPVQCCLNGAVSRQATAGRLAAAGFELLLWEDHTKALKELAGQIIFTYGSLENFLGLSCNKNNGSECGTGYASKPGYFLAVARKGVLNDG
jgi:ubiquinone/menaquinone biosynthesis C-methylase UbiE